MALKNIGALWLKTREDGTKFFSGTINNGIHGDINIVVFKNEKKDSEKSPEGLDHGVGHFRPLSITRQRHLLAYHGMQ